MKYFIDYENVRDEGFIGCENLKAKDHLFIFYSANAGKIGIEALSSLMDKTNNIHFEPITKTGKNALDFILASRLGYMIAQGGKHFAIISKDTGYDPMIAYWRKLGYDVYRAINLKGQVKVKSVKKKAPKKKKKAPKKTVIQENENQLTALPEKRRKVLKNVLRNVGIKENQFDQALTIFFEAEDVEAMNNKFTEEFDAKQANALTKQLSAHKSHLMKTITTAS